MNNIVVNWNGYKCVVESNVDPHEWQNYFSKVNTLLGKGFVIIQDYEKDENYIENKLIYINGKKKAFYLNNESFIFYYPWKEATQNNNFECILLLIFLRHLYCNGIVALHASGVVYNGKAFIFLGPKESGKTSISVRLCKEYNAKLICNDYITITYRNDCIVAFGGDGIKKISLRSHALQKIDPSLFNKYFNANEFGVQQRINTAELNIRAEDASVNLNTIIFLGLGQTERLSVERNISLKTMVDLYANITELIRGTSMVLFDDENEIGLFIPDVITENIHMNVHTLIKKICERKAVMSIRGNMDDIIHYITNEL